MTRAPACRVACLLLIASFSLAHAQRDPARLPAKPELVAVDIGQPIILRTGEAGRSEYTLPPPLEAGVPLQMVVPRSGHASALAVLRGQRLEGIQARVSRLASAVGAFLPWRVKKGPFGTKETRQSPAVLTTRTKREGQPNDQKGRLRESRESDRFIVAQGNPEQPGPTCVKGATGQRSPHRQPAR